MAVNNLPVGRFVNAVYIVPHPDTVVNARRHELCACLRAEIGRIDQARMVQAGQLTGSTCHCLACRNKSSLARHFQWVFGFCLLRVILKETWMPLPQTVKHAVLAL